jgi:NhaP-type Na+/H+ or K+/H+ antiporter
MTIFLHYYSSYTLQTTTNSGNSSSNSLSIRDCLLLSTILSSTDPITTLTVYSNLKIHFNLYYLVFGESILNDAVSVTLYNTLTRNILQKTVTTDAADIFSSEEILLILGEFMIVFIISSLIGYCMGILIAFLLRKVADWKESYSSRDSYLKQHLPLQQIDEEFSRSDNDILHSSVANDIPGRNNYLSSEDPSVTTNDTSQQPDHSHTTRPNSSSIIHPHHPDEIIPILFLFFLCYFSFFLSETFQCSGIVTIFFSGISTRRYIMKHLNTTIKLLFTRIMEILSHLMETSCFIIMGLSIFLISLDAYHWSFIAMIFGLCVVGRILPVYFLLNLVIVIPSLSPHHLTS